MSDQDFDQVLAGLDADEKKEVPKAAKRGYRAQPRPVAVPPAGSARRTTATSVQRGKRADDAYTQVNASIRKELKPSLFFYLKQDGKTLSEVVEDFLEAYVEERGGIIGASRKRR
jgi:hypothetical protein